MSRRGRYNKENDNNDVNNNVNNNDDKIDNNNMDNVNNNDLDVDDINKNSENNISEKIDDNKMINVNDSKYVDIVHKKKKINFLIVFVIISFIIFVITLFCYVNKSNYDIYNNVYLENYDISGYTKEELEEYLKNKNNDILSDSLVNVCSSDDKLMEISSEDIELEIDINKTLMECFSFGRDKGLVNNNINIFKTLFSKHNIEICYKYNEEKIDEIIKKIDLSLPNRYVDDSYSLDEIKKSLIIKKGVSGNSIYFKETEEDIVKLLKENTIKTYELKLEEMKPNTLNVEKIYNEIKTEPKNAYIDDSKTPVSFVKEQVGYDFDIDSFNEFLNKEENKIEGKELEYSLNVIEPEIKLEDIDYSKYNEKLAGFTTYFNSASYNRASNLKVALSYLDGKIIMPGETFSVTNTLGNITTSQGYKAASTFKGGKVVQEIGGGVCQTSSTLYNAALIAGLQIVERHSHSLPVGYVSPSQDATIYVGVLDLKFKNTRKYPVKIVTSYNAAGSINISIHGVKEEIEYDYSIESVYISKIPYKTTYQYDENLEKGTNITLVNGVNGYKSKAYLTKSLNGKVISKQLLSEDSYGALNAVVKVGMKEVIEGE